MKKLSMIIVFSMVLLLSTISGVASAGAAAIKDVNGDDVTYKKNYIIKTKIKNPVGIPEYYYVYDEIRTIGRDFISGTSSYSGAGNYYFAGGTGTIEEGKNYDLSSSRDGRSWNFLPPAGVYPHGGIYLSTDVGDTSFTKSSSGEGYDLKVDGHIFIFNTGNSSFNNVGDGHEFTMSFIPA